MAEEWNIGFDANNLVFYDTDKTIEFGPVLDDVGVPIDVSGWSIGWTVRRKPNSPNPPLIYKETGGSGVSVVGVYDADPDANTQRVQVVLEDTDTYDPAGSPAVDIRPGTYVHGLKRLDPGAEDILTYGKFKLSQAAPWE